MGRGVPKTRSSHPMQSDGLRYFLHELTGGVFSRSRHSVQPFTRLSYAALYSHAPQVRDSESFVSFISGMLLKPDESRTVRHILKKAHNLQGRRSMLMSSTESEGGARATVHRWLRAAVSCRPSKFSCPGPAELPGSGAMAKRRS